MRPAWKTGSVRIEVADNGPGIDPELAKRVFEPFVTTKPAGIGAGIRLSVCHGIASAHGGAIELIGTPGEGARFVIRLRVQHDERPPATPRADAGGRGGRCSWSTTSRRSRSSMPRSCAAKASTSPGRQRPRGARAPAARAVRSGGERLRMPDVDGPELYRALAKGPGDQASRMIFITGDALSHQVEQFLAETGTEVLEKPVSPKELVARVRVGLAAG